MLSSYIFNSNSRVIARKVGAFALSLAAVYVVVILALSTTKVDGLSVLQISTGNYAVRGDVRGTLQRFRDIEKAGEVDILFAGSSHSYASFDTRVFSGSGLTSFNMGTPSQTPLNTFYLLKRYLGQLNPKLVIYEIYHPNLASDGLESFYDLNSNQAPSFELFSMALATKNPHAINSFSARLLEALVGNIDAALQLGSPHLTYVTGGFLAHNNQLGDTLFGEPEDITIDQTQWEYMQDIIELIQNSGAELLVLVTPMPEGRVNMITNYSEISGAIANVCADEFVTFYDFNNTPTLRDLKNYADYHHLNGRGAEIFSDIIVDSLRVNQAFADCLSLTAEVATR